MRRLGWQDELLLRVGGYFGVGTSVTSALSAHSEPHGASGLAEPPNDSLNLEQRPVVGVHAFS